MYYKKKNMMMVILSLFMVACGGGSQDDTNQNQPNTTTAPVKPVPSTVVDAITNVEEKIYVTNGIIIDDFNSNTGNTVKGWSFNNGGEFPGAKGTLALTASEDKGFAANLTADLNCGELKPYGTSIGICGRYVSMTKKLEQPLAVLSDNKNFIYLSVKTSSALLATGLRVVDSTGQTLQFSFSPRTLETAAGATWAKIIVPINSTTAFWGGANDGKIHDSISSISLLASLNPNGIIPPVSSLSIDEVKFLNSGDATFSLNKNSDSFKNAVIPKLGDRFAVAAHQVPEKALAHAKNIGITNIRIDLTWSYIESKGKFNFSSYQTVLNQLAKYNMSALFILDYGHPDHGGGASPTLPEHREAFNEFARQAAAFAMGKNVVALEIWNEPDNSNFWKDGNPETYAQLLVSATQAIKSIDPNRKVLNGGPSWVNIPYIYNVAKYGNLNSLSLEGFAIHGYRAWAPETFAHDMAPMKEVLVAQGISNPNIWVTEWGQSSFNAVNQNIYGDGHDEKALARQGVLVARTMLTQLSLNLPMMTLYELFNGGNDAKNGEHNFGLLDRSLNPKPAYTSLKTLFDMTSNKNYAGVVKNVPPNVHAMKWMGDSSNVFAAWVESSITTVTINLPVNSKVTSWNGTQINVLPGTNSIRLKEEDGPVFIEIT